jgi:hypothetical protein
MLLGIKLHLAVRLRLGDLRGVGGLGGVRGLVVGLVGFLVLVAVGGGGAGVVVVGGRGGRLSVARGDRRATVKDRAKSGDISGQAFGRMILAVVVKGRSQDILLLYVSSGEEARARGIRGEVTSSPVVVDLLVDVDDVSFEEAKIVGSRLYPIIEGGKGGTGGA